MMPIDMIIFDMDGVLTHSHMDARLQVLAERSGVAAEVILREIFESGFEDDANAGRWTLDQYVEGFRERIRADMSLEGMVWRVRGFERTTSRA